MANRSADSGSQRKVGGVAGKVAVLFIAALVPAQADENPLREFFPYGVYVGGNDPEWRGQAVTEEGRAAAFDRVCRDLAEHGMNCAWLSNLRWENLPLWLEAGRRHGVRMIPQAGGPPGFVRPGWFKDREDLVRRVGPFYRDLAEKYGSDPALLAWSLTEENPPVPWFYEALRDLTRKMEEWDPRHPAITMDNKASSAWMNAQVVRPRGMARDVYVFFVNGLHGPYEPIGFKSLLTRECQKFQAASSSIDAVYWILGQGMQLWSYGARGSSAVWRYPTPEEIRWQVWASIQQGAKGFFYFIYQGPPKPRERGEFMEGLRDRTGQETPQYRMAAEVGQQIRPLMPLLLQLDVAPLHQDVVYWENTPVEGKTFVHRGTGQRFLIVVNHDCERMQRVGIELGYWPRFLQKEEKLFDLRGGQRLDYQTLKLATLLPGDGTIYFVGTEEEWQTFSATFYGS